MVVGYLQDRSMQCVMIILAEDASYSNEALLHLVYGRPCSRARDSTQPGSGILLSSSECSRLSEKKIAFHCTSRRTVSHWLLVCKAGGDFEVETKGIYAGKI